jgi:hypothetical protein
MYSKSVILKRILSNAYVTLGQLWIGGFPLLATLELPWRDNHKMVSCIPAGAYTIMRVNLPKFGTTYEVLGVPGRSEILFHKGNYPSHTEGCILVGLHFSGTPESPMLCETEAGKFLFLQQLTADKYIMEVTNP